MAMGITGPYHEQLGGGEQESVIDFSFFTTTSFPDT